MGKIKQGILGGFSGKVGNVIGTSWKGISVVKVMPQSVANPKTTPQEAQRTLLSNAVAFATEILSSIIKPLNDRFAQKMSGYNMFISRNLSLFTSKTLSDPMQLVIASGKIDKTDVSVTADASDHELTLHWTPDGGVGYKMDSDILYVVAINKEQEVVAAYPAHATRDAGVSSLVPPSGFLIAGQTIYIACAFLRADGSLVSDTSNASVVISA